MLIYVNKYNNLRQMYLYGAVNFQNVISRVGGGIFCVCVSCKGIVIGSLSSWQILDVLFQTQLGE